PARPESLSDARVPFAAPTRTARASLHSKSCAEPPDALFHKPSERRRRCAVEFPGASLVARQNTDNRPASLHIGNKHSRDAGGEGERWAGSKSDPCQATSKPLLRNG